MYKCLIADDEPLAHKLIANFLSKCNHYEVIKTCYDGKELLNVLAETNFDLLFLDLSMPFVTGKEILNIYPIGPKTILTTGETDFAINAYGHDILDYLLKPFSFERFYKAILKFESKNATATLRTSLHNTLIEKHPIETKNYIIVKQEHTSIKIYLNEIMFIKAMGNYVKIYTIEKTILTIITMKEIDVVLPQNQFIRIHKSYIVNLTNVQKVSSESVFIRGEELPLGKTYKNLFLNAFK